MSFRKMKDHGVDHMAEVFKRKAFDDVYDLSTDILLHQTKCSYEAAKILHREQKNIQRKREKEISRSLSQCMGKYDENLNELKEAVAVINQHLEKSPRKIPNTPSLRKPKNLKQQAERFSRSSRGIEQKLTEERALQISKYDVSKVQPQKQSLGSTDRAREMDSNQTQMIRKDDELKRAKKLRIELQQKVKLLEEENERLQHELQTEKTDKDNAIKRLSKPVSSKLRDDSADITDLIDQTRPTKVAEKLSELYDNQWTDAFDLLEQQMGEKQVIQTLLNTLMMAYTTCQELSSRNFFERVQKAIELPTEAAELSNNKVVLSDQFKQVIKEFRKNRAPFVIRDVEKAVRPRLQLSKHQSKEVQEYVTACIEIVWLCAVENPPLELDAKFTDSFDTNVFKAYTKRGEFVDFMVWPAMFLHKGGPLLSKGVAQGRCDNQLPDVPDRPIPTNTLKGGLSIQTGTYTHRHFSNQPRQQYHYRDHESYQRPDNRNQPHYNRPKTIFVPSRTNAQTDYGLKQRLSKPVSSKLRDDSADTTDLSDQTRPTKVAEKLSELYDNQWSDSFDILEQEMEQKQVIHTLLNTLMMAYTTCQELSSRNFFERVQKAIELPTEAAELSNYKVVLSDQLKQEIKVFRKTRAPFVIRDVEKAVRPRLQLAKHQSKEVQEFVTACIEIAWLCAVQDPPLELDAKFTNRFDTNVFKDYEKRGEFVDFMVWPAMFLHKGGPLLSKGVAQGRCDNKPRDVPDRPIPTNTRKGGYNTQTGTYTHIHSSNQPRQENQVNYRDHQSYQKPDNRKQHHNDQSKTRFMYTPSRTSAAREYGHTRTYTIESTDM